jgi:hypothetical protein
VPVVFKGQFLNEILGNLLSMRTSFQHDRDRDVAVWEDMLSVDPPNTSTADFYNMVRVRRMAAFDDVLREIDSNLTKFASDLKSTVDIEILDSKLQNGSYKPTCPHSRPTLHPKLYYDRFGRNFFETSTLLLADADFWSWNVCGTTDSNVRALLGSLNGPFPDELLKCVDNSKVANTEFHLTLSGLSMSVHAPLIAVKLYCFFGNTCLFASESILQRPSLVPINLAFSDIVSRSLSESPIVHGDIDFLDYEKGSPITVQLYFKHIASIKNRRLLFVLHRDTGQERSSSELGIASVTVGLDAFFCDEPKSVKLPLFNRLVHVDCNGDILGLERCSSLWASDVADHDILAFELSVVCVLEFQGILSPQKLNHRVDETLQSLSCQHLKNFLTDCNVPTCSVDANERFYIELVSHKAAKLQHNSEVRFHIVDLSCDSFFPVVFSGRASLICKGVYEISASVDWSVSENMCIVVEQCDTFLPICCLKVLKQQNQNANSCAFICMQHPDPSSTSVLIGFCHKIQTDEDAERFIPQFVNWRSRFIPAAGDLVFEGSRFGFERSEQLGCWVSFFESSSNKKEEQRINITNGNFDAVFDATNCICPVHQKPCQCVLKFDSALFEARRIFVCEDCVNSGHIQESTNKIICVASDGFISVKNAVEKLLPLYDPSWKLLEKLNQEIKVLQDYEIAAELEALQMGLDICLAKVRSFVLDVASQSIPKPSVLQALPASDVSLLYQWMDALCSERVNCINRITPHLFTAFSGLQQLGYAESLHPKKLGYIHLNGNDEHPDTLVWQLLNTDRSATDMNLFELAFDLNFVVCTRGYVNVAAREDAATVFVRRDVAGVDVSSGKVLKVGFEVNLKHESLSSIQHRDISIIAWLRQSCIPDVSIIPKDFNSQASSKELIDSNVDISDQDIELVNQQLLSLFSTSKLDYQGIDASNVSYTAACIIYSISHDDVFYRLRLDVLHVFPNPDGMMLAIKKIKDLSLLSVSPSEAYVSLPINEFGFLEKKVLAIVARFIFSQTYEVPLIVTGLLNTAGFPMTLGSDLPTIMKSRSRVDRYYCSRILGQSAIPGSDGQCGPNDGPQCKDCKTAQDVYMATHESSNLSYVHNLSDSLSSYAFMNSYTMQKMQVFIGDHIKLQVRTGDRAIVCTVVPDDMCFKDSVRLSSRSCAKLRLRLGDIVHAHRCKVSLAKRIIYRSDGPALSARILDSKDVVVFQNSIITVGDVFRFRSGEADCSVQILCTDPDGVCVVTSDTEMIPDVNIFEDTLHSGEITAAKKSFPSRGDMICLRRSDGDTQTLLRKRATSSRYLYSSE